MTVRGAEAMNCCPYGVAGSTEMVRPDIPRSLLRKMKPGSKDKKIKILISGKELLELQRHTCSMAESFGLDCRIENIMGYVLSGFIAGI